MGHSHSREDTASQVEPSPLPDESKPHHSFFKTLAADIMTSFTGSTSPPLTTTPPTSSGPLTSSSPTTSSYYEDDCSTRSCLYFSTSKESTILFQTWKVSSDSDFWMAIGGIVALGLLYEMVWMSAWIPLLLKTHVLRYFQALFHFTLLILSWRDATLSTLQVKSFRGCLLLEAQAAAANAENKPILLRDWNEQRREEMVPDFLQHLLCSMFYLLEWTLFFLLCLVVIGFNVWNLLAALTGLTVGYMLFGRGRLN